MSPHRHMARQQYRARLSLFWEALWPSLMPAICIVGLFLALALIELPQQLPGWLHLAGLLAFAGALLFALWRGLRSLAWPGLQAARRRVERASALSHRPLEGLHVSWRASALTFWRSIALTS